MDMYQKRRERKENKINKESEKKTNINWFPGHMSKAKRDISERLKLVDIVFEMLDARVPFSSSNPEILTIVGNKPRLLLLNKASLADSRQTQKWLEYFGKNNMPALAIDSLNLDNVGKILKLAKEILAPLFIKKQEKGIQKKSIRALIIGIPNSGKSTLINALAKRKATAVGDRPGITKNNAWIKVSDELEIMDTPGIFWPKFATETTALNLALSGAIKDDILPLDDVVIYGFRLLDRYYQSQFIKRYSLKEYDINDPLSIYEHIGRLRGCLQNGEIDYERVNRLFLQDIRGTVFGGVTFDIYEEHVSV